MLIKFDEPIACAAGDACFTSSHAPHYLVALHSAAPLRFSNWTFVFTDPLPCEPVELEYPEHTRDFDTVSPPGVTHPGGSLLCQIASICGFLCDSLMDHPRFVETIL